MILVIDVGNTNITCGVYDGKKLATTFRLMSKAAHTSDEYGMNIRQILEYNGISKEQIEGTIIASVVPNVMHSLTGGIVRYLGKQPLIVGAGTKTGIRIVTENPKEIGPDRIVDAVAAYEKYGGPVLVRLTLDDKGAITGLKVGGARFAETEGVGSRVKEDAFVEPFIGKTPPLTLGEDVDAIAGASISSQAVVDAVNEAAAFLKETPSVGTK